MYGIPLKQKPHGGLIRGPGTGTSDSIKKKVAPGSFIMPADSTQALGLGKKIPVNLSNGEYELPPEQVHAVGVQALRQAKDATHTQVPEPQGLGRELFFVNGGDVDERDKLKPLGLGGRTVGPQGRPMLPRTTSAPPEPMRGPRGLGRDLGSTAVAAPAGELNDIGQAAVLEPPTHALSTTVGQDPAQTYKAPAAGQQADQPVGLASDTLVNTGVGGAVTRMGANGQEFSNHPSDAKYAGEMPVGGVGTIGDGKGTFSVMGEAGDAQRAIATFDRANAIRRDTRNIARQGELGDGGGRVTVVRDSSRAPQIAEIMNARLEQQEARGLRADQQLQQTNTRANQEAAERSEKHQQDMEIGAVSLDATRQLESIKAQLADPAVTGDQRAQLETAYYALGTTPDKRVEIEKKELERDLLRQELEQTGSGDGVKLTEQQSKDLGYFSRGNAANAALATQGDALTARATGERGRLRGMTDALVRGTPLLGDSALGNSLVSSERQKAEQSSREVLAAILRKDTGAAITQQEMEIYGRMYLSQPGDSDDVLNQKAEARTRALESIRMGLGTAERKAKPLADGHRAADSGPVQIHSDDDYSALPPGTTFTAPDGTTRRKP